MKFEEEDIDRHGNFKYDKCDKAFQSEKQLTVPAKKHEKFPFEECYSEFKFESLLEKHARAVYGSLKNVCHYFNDENECR